MYTYKEFILKTVLNLPFDKHFYLQALFGKGMNWKLSRGENKIHVSAEKGFNTDICNDLDLWPRNLEQNHCISFSYSHYLDEV